jgi:hypothetical protein
LNVKLDVGIKLPLAKADDRINELYASNENVSYELPEVAINNFAEVFDLLVILPYLKLPVENTAASTLLESK